MKETVELNNLSENELFKIIGEVALIFHEGISLENTVLVSDKKKFRNCFLGSEAVANQSDMLGKPIPTNGNIPIVLQTGVMKTSIIPKEFYGVAFKSTTLPIKNYEESIIGTITLMLSLKSQSALQETAGNISVSSEQISATTEELASSAMMLSSNVSEVLDQTQEILKLIEKTNGILDFVNSVAKNSRLLGLNAAIEAARAGEVGRVFAVVADEIRKMAENSSNSVKDTKELISAINNKVNGLMKKVQELTDVANTQAAATQEITATIQSFAENVQIMQEISEII